MTATEPAIPAGTSKDKARASRAWIFPSFGTPWLMIGVLLFLLASITLLVLAAAEPQYYAATSSFRLVRVVGSHRGEVAAVFLAGAGVLFMLTRLPI